VTPMFFSWRFMPSFSVSAIPSQSARAPLFFYFRILVLCLVLRVLPPLRFELSGCAGEVKSCCRGPTRLSTDLLLYKQQSAYLICGGRTTLKQNLTVTSNSTIDKNQQRNNHLHRPTMMVQNVVDCGVLTGLTGNCSSSWSVRVLFLTVLSLLRDFGSEMGSIMVGKPLFDRCHQRDDSGGVDCCVAVRFAP
jgi:hypothetical protein